MMEVIRQVKRHYISWGCDSIVTITVTELAAITNSINPTICSNGSYVYDGVTYGDNTTGTHIFTSTLGCDSTVTVTLTIQNVINTNLDTLYVMVVYSC